MKKLNTGFTLIELLVVIAIIGILAGILFVAIDPKAQTDKANDASAKSELAQARTQAALSFSNHENYSSVCSDISKLVDDCVTGTNDSETAWAASVDLVAGANDGKVMCADSTGKTAVQNAAPAGTTCD